MDATQYNMIHQEPPAGQADQDERTLKKQTIKKGARRTPPNYALITILMINNTRAMVKLSILISNKKSPYNL